MFNITEKLIFNLISKDKENLVKLGKAIRVDFEGILAYYIIFDEIPIKEALLKISKDIFKEYKDKIEIWNMIQKELNIPQK